MNAEQWQIIEGIFEEYCGDCPNQPFALQGADCWQNCDEFQPIYEEILTEAETQTERNKKMSPNINDMRETKYVSQNDVDPAVLVTIAKITEEDVSLDNEPTDKKWTVHFKEDIKPLVLNWTNLNLIAIIVGSESTEDWIGKQIVLWRDKNIMFKGELKGGIRVREVRRQQTEPDVPESPVTEQPQGTVTNPDYREEGREAEGNGVPF